MIHIRLVGGLGNQLFQLGAALELSKYAEKINVNISYLNKYKSKRTPDIDKILHLPSNKFTFSNEFIPIHHLRLAKIFNFSTSNFAFINDKNFNQYIFRQNYCKNIYVDGYFIENISDEIFSTFIKNIKKYLIDIDKNNLVREECVIHIRGGDFLELGYELDNIRNFYRDAVSKISEVNRNINFRLVTDDLEYSRYILEGIDYKYSKSSIKEDFNLIRFSRHKIISNSTFAFWGACLSIDESGITIAPKEWKKGVARNIHIPNELR